jgi:hypothetical protein
LEADSAGPEFVAVHREVPKEDASVKPVGRRKKRHRGRNLEAERLQKPKDGPLKKLAAAGRKMSRCSGVAWHQGIRHEGPLVEQGRPKNQSRNKFARGTRGGRMPGMGQLMHQEGTNGTKNRDFNE